MGNGKVGGEWRRGNDRGKQRRGPQGLVHTLVRNPEKCLDCRTDLIGGAATQTFVPGGKHPHAVTVTRICSLPVALIVCTLKESRLYGRQLLLGASKLGGQLAESLGVIYGKACV